MNEFHDSFNSKRLSLNLVVLLDLQIRELRTQVRCKLTCVQFANDDPLVLAEHLARVLRQRSNIIEMRQIAAQLIRCSVQMTFRTTPAYKQRAARLKV